tara:strand:+ start:314 stop:475 length:162 start_codon:yes stop_codon:yes gene_type:complete
LKRKSAKSKMPTLALMTARYRMHGYKRPKGCARVYMQGFTDAKNRYKRSLRKN